MRARLFLISFGAALLLALGVAATACGGDGALSLEEYFQRLDAIQNESDARFEALEAEEPDIDDDDVLDEEEKEALRDSFAAFPTIFREAIDKADDLDPPAEAEEAHDELVAAGEALVESQSELQEDFLARLADIESTSELEELFSELFENAEAQAASERFTAACLALQDIANANDIAVDLECEEDEEGEGTSTAGQFKVL